MRHPRHPLKSEIAMMTLPQMLATLDDIGETEEAAAYERAAAEAHGRLGM